MLVAKTVNSNQGVIDFIEGALKAQGAAGTNTGGSPNFSDLTPGAFAEVQAGDAFYISGVLAPFVVQSKTNDNNIVLTTNITPAHTADGKWKAKRGGVGVSSLQWEPQRDPVVEGKWHIFYNTTTFGI